MNWKIKRDRFYSKLYEQYGKDFIIKAGWFEDSNTEDYQIDDSLDIMCTPLHFMNLNAKNNKPCVLLSTGSFAPVHNGHIETMIKTKDYLENMGWDVVGGFFAPDHDEYITAKLGKEAIPFKHRMKYILDAVKNISWLTVDPWAGIFQKYAVNFTDIITRLERYIEKHVGFHIPVIFVCGEDNARFADTFRNEGYCAVVDRPGYSRPMFRIRKYGDERIFYIPNSNDESSTRIRKNQELVINHNYNKRAVIRYTPGQYEHEVNRLLKLISTQFYKIDVIMSDNQNRSIKKIADNIITLDAYTDCKNKLQISREYDYFGFKKLGYTNRPGSPIIQQQIDGLDTTNDFILHDDDIFTGETIRYARNLLERNGINIAGTMTYITANSNEEVIDIRDFILDAPDGGLVVRQSDGSNKRVPYVYPYVCPYVRSSIEDPMRFSIAIWKINLEYAEKMNNQSNVALCKENLKLLQQFI